MPWESSIFQSSHLPALHCLVLFFSSLWPLKTASAGPSSLISFKTWVHGPFPGYGPVVRADCKTAVQPLPQANSGLPICWSRYHRFSKKCSRVPTFMRNYVLYPGKKRRGFLSAFVSTGAWGEEEQRRKVQVGIWYLFLYSFSPFLLPLSHVAPSLTLFLLSSCPHFPTSLSFFIVQRGKTDKETNKCSLVRCFERRMWRLDEGQPKEP